MENIGFPGDVPHSVALDTTTNVFILDGIIKVTWKELRGRAEDVYGCYSVLVKAKQACLCCIGEFAGAQCHVPASKHDLEFAKASRNEDLKEKPEVTSLAEDQLQLYIFAWSSEDVVIQNRILEKMSVHSSSKSELKTEGAEESDLVRRPVESGLELLSSGEWNLEGGEFLFKQVAGDLDKKRDANFGTSESRATKKVEPTVNAENTTLSSNQQRIKSNLLKLLFKSLENRIHLELIQHSYVPLAQYSIYTKFCLDNPNNFYKMFHQELGLSAIKFKFFVCRTGNNFRIGLHAILTPTMLYPFPSSVADFKLNASLQSSLGLLPSTKAPSGEIAPLVVMTAPTGLIGVLADMSELDSPSVEFSVQNRRILDEWKEKYHIYDKSLVTILVGHVAYKFPRCCVFLMHPPHLPCVAIPRSLSHRKRGGGEKESSSSVVVTSGVDSNSGRKSRYSLEEIKKMLPKWTEIPRLDPFQYYQELFMQAFLDVAELVSCTSRLERDSLVSDPFLLISKLSYQEQLVQGGEASALNVKKRRRTLTEEGGEDVPEGGCLNKKKQMVSNVSDGLAERERVRAASAAVADVVKGDEALARFDVSAAELEEEQRKESSDLPESMKMIVEGDFQSSDKDGPGLCDKDLSDWLELQSVDCLSGSAYGADFRSSVCFPLSSDHRSQHLLPQKYEIYSKIDLVRDVVRLESLESEVPLEATKLDDGRSSLEKVRFSDRVRVNEGIRDQGHRMETSDMPSSWLGNRGETVEQGGQKEEEESSDGFESDSSHLSLSEELNQISHLSLNHALSPEKTTFDYYSANTCTDFSRPMNLATSLNNFHYDPSVNCTGEPSTADTDQIKRLDIRVDPEVRPIEVDRPYVHLSGSTYQIQDEHVHTDQEDSDSQSESPCPDGGDSSRSDLTRQIDRRHRHHFDCSALTGDFDPFCTQNAEPSAFFLADWTRKSSFSLRDFSTSALLRVMSHAPRSSAQLGFMLNCYNYFNAHTGTLLYNYLPLLFNNEVCMAAAQAPNPDTGPSVSTTPSDVPVVDTPPSSRDVDAGILEILVQEALAIYTPFSLFSAQMDQEDTMDVLKAYQHLDAARDHAAVCHRSLFVSGTDSASRLVTARSAPLSANPTLTASVWVSSVECSEGPFTLQDWILGSASPSFPFGPRCKWNGSIEASQRNWAGTGSQWPITRSNHVAEYQFMLRALSSSILPAALQLKDCVRGPLTVRQFQEALTSAALPGKADSSSSSRAMSLSSREDVYTECEVFDVPMVVVGHDANWLEISPTALYFWEKLNLKPYSPQKDVFYYVIAPEFALDEVSIFFKQLSTVYEQCNLGCHSAADEYDLTDGILSFSNVTASVSERASAPDAGESSDLFEIGAAQLGAYETCGARIGAYLTDASKHYGKSVVVYVVNPYTIESIASPAAGEATSVQGIAGCTAGLGATHAQKVLAHKSAILLMQTCLASIRRNCKHSRCLIPLSISTARVMSPLSQVMHFKELAFNVFTRCRRVSFYSQWDSSSATVTSVNAARATPEGRSKFYEPLFVISHGQHVPIRSSSELQDGRNDPSFSSKPRPGFSSPLPAESDAPADRTLHVSYVLTVAFLSYSLVDSNGELLEAGALPTMSDVTVALYQLWSVVFKLLPQTTHRWCVIFGKLGRLRRSEIKEWVEIVCNTSEEDRHRSKIHQIALVSLCSSSTLQVIPGWHDRPATTESDARAVPSACVESQFLNSMMSLSDDASSLSGRDLAVYDYCPAAIDECQGIGDVLACSFLLRANSLWEHASLFSQDVTQAYVIRLYHIFSLGDSSASTCHTQPNPSERTHDRELRLMIRNVTREYYRLSWLNLSPSSPKRFDMLPLNYKVVQRLSSMIQHTLSTN